MEGAGKMFSIVYDASLGLIRCRIEGFFSDREISSVISATRQAKATCRRLHGDVKMLVTTDGQVQSPESMKAVAEQRGAQVSRYDRRAFVLPSSLQKMQVSRIFDLEHEKLFVSEQAAITWLLADRAYRA